MVQQLISDSEIDEVIYPESDGLPMADNTEQYEWIVIIKENLELLFASILNVFVAGNLFWYPVEGSNRIRQAPDVMVVIGARKGKRGSYQQWRENNQTPQVVFEILSPGNRAREMNDKLEFYRQYGVEEYYVYNPQKFRLEIWLRNGEELVLQLLVNNWISPRLGIKFVMTNLGLEIYNPDGSKFLTFLELNRLRQEAEQRAGLAEQKAELERQRANFALQEVETERQRALTAEEQALAERQRAESERQRALTAEEQALAERQRAESERQRALTAEEQALAERQRAESERQRALTAEERALTAEERALNAEANLTEERQRLELLAERLRALGLNHEELI